MEEIVDERMNAVLAKSMDEIRLLPECVQEEVTWNGKRVALTTYHESLESDRHRVIVQAIRPRWGGLINAAIARGYEFSSAGSSRKLLTEELYDYT